MKKLLLYLGALFALGVCCGSAKAQLINCPSGFTSSGACGVSTSGGAQTFWNQNALSGSKSVIIPTGCTHCGQSMNTQAQVNVQAFTATWSFTPNEWNGAFILQRNMNNQVSGGGCSGTNCTFSAGAGCEAGFYQAFNSSNVSGDHIFALIFADNYSDRTSSSGFTGSTVQIYQPQQSPCNPNDSQPWYWSTSKISTSPISLSNGSSINTCHQTVGGTCDTYTAKLVYDGTTLTLTMFNVTAGGACPGASCFTQAWNNINIPSIVGSNTAWLGLAGGTGNTPSAFPYTINSLVYTVTTPPSVPSFQTYTSATAAGTPHAAAPTFSPVAGSYSGTQSVTISSTTTGSYACYILSATTPAIMPQTDQQNGCTVGTKYTSPVSVASTQTLYAQAGTNAPANVSGTLLANSDLTVGAFTIGSTAAAPTASPVPGTYSSTQTVTLTTTTGGATICYTIDGSTPLAATAGTCSHGTTYSGTISVATTLTIKAIATISGSTNSAVQSFAYMITPTCALAANIPPDSYQLIPGSVRQVNVTETGCPSGSLTNLTVSGGVVTGAGTGFSFTVGKTLVLSNIIVTGSGIVYPFDVVNGAPLTILTATSTSFTASYGRSAVSIGSTPVTGTASQISFVNWSTATTTGSVTGTLSCTSSCIPNTILTMGATAGNCTQTGGVVTSTQVLTVTATAIDSGSSASFPIYQCNNTTAVVIDGAGYDHVYQAQPIEIQSHVFGAHNKAVTWAITSSPGGGDGALDSTTARNTRFHATVTGRYTLTATSGFDVTKSASTIVYVAPAAIPSYAAAPPEHSIPTPCTVDPAMTGTTYDVGPSQTNHTINSIPFNTLTAGGYTVRLHNEDTTGHAPTTFAEYIQLASVGSNAQPVVICGIPDSLGNYPVMSGNGAHGPTYANTFLYGAGLINTFPTSGTCNGYFPTAPCGPNHVLVTGIKFIDATTPYTGFEADGVTPFNWFDGSNAFDGRVGTNFTFRGNHCDFTSQCVGTYDNAANFGYSAITQSVAILHNYMTNQSLSGSSTSHPIYAQSYGMFIGYNLIMSPVSGATNSCIKVRGIGVVVVGNHCDEHYSREVDWVEVQDSYNYTNAYDYITNGPVSNGDTLGLNVVAGYQEELQSDNIQYSNAYYDPGAQPNNIHFMADHDDNAGDYGMASRYGILTSFFETYYICGQTYDTSSSLFPENYFLTPQFVIENNIVYCTTNTMHFNSLANFTAKMHTNLYTAGSFDNSTPIYGGHYNYADYLGWTNDSYFNPGIPWMMSPINPRITGNLSTDFLTTSIAPFDTTTLHLVGGSAAIGAASALTDEAALFSIDSDAVDLNGVVTARSTIVDVGAFSMTSAPPATNVILNGILKLSGTVVVR